MANAGGTGVWDSGAEQKIGAEQIGARPAGRVLVTGASGFLGADFAKRLAQQGWTVRALARDPGRIPQAHGIEPGLLPDLRGEIEWAPLLAGCTSVVHLAGIAHATASIAGDEYSAVNAQSVARLSAAARAAGVERFVYVSTIRAQSGPVASHVLTERDPPCPTDAYGRAKLDGERGMEAALAGSATSGFVLRPVLVFGPGAKGNLRTLYRLARSPFPLPLRGLKGRSSLLSQANLAGAITHALTSKDSPGTYLVADDGALTVAEIVTALRVGLARAPHLVTLPQGVVGPLIRALGKGAMLDRINGNMIVDTACLRATGWRPQGKTAEGLALAMAADRREPK